MIANANISTRVRALYLNKSYHFENLAKPNIRTRKEEQCFKIYGKARIQRACK